MLNLYTTSSDKKCGKTFISTGIAATMQSLGYSTSVYKPIQTAGIEINGFMQSPDLTFVKTIDPYINTHFTYLYKNNTEPLIASDMENEPIDCDLILNEYKRISAVSDCTIIDGDGGVLSPIAPQIQNVDLIKKLTKSIIIVTTPSENAINSTLTAIFAAQEKGLDVRGVVVNNISDNSPKYLITSIPRVIEEYSNVKIMGLVPHLKKGFSPEDLITAILNGIDIESIFGIKIEKLDIS